MKYVNLKTGLAAIVVCTLVLSQLEAANTTPGRPSVILQVKGTAIGETRDIDTDGDGTADTTAECYDIGLYDPETGFQIGTVSDRLSDVNVVADDDPLNQPLGFNLALTGTTFFNLPGGSLVTQGLTTVQPVLRPTTRDGVTYTHVTGANGDGGVQYGTGKFKLSSGKARLSGLVDISRLLTNNEISFDCLFVVDFD
jgi:hypothetical protein